MAIGYTHGVTRVSDLNQAQLVIDMEEMAAELDQDSYFFETVTRKLRNGVQTANRMKHEFRERRLIPMVTAVDTGGAAGGATSIPVLNTDIFHRDQLVYAPATGEMFVVAEDVGGEASAGEVKVRKLDTNDSTGIVNALSEGDILIVGTEAHAEGEAIPPAYSTTEENFYTYCYQFDRVREGTDIEAAEEHYGESEIEIQRRQFWIETKRALNMMLYVGQEVRETASGDGRRHSMRGLNSWLTTLAVDGAGLTGGLTLPNLGTILRPTKAYGASSMRKLGIAGQNAWAAISAFAGDTVRIEPGKDQKWGVTFNRLITAFGEVDVGYDHMLSEEYGLAGAFYLLDPKFIYQFQMRNLPLVLKTNRVNPTEIHINRDVITGTRGLVVKLPELHRWVYDVPAPS